MVVLKATRLIQNIQAFFGREATPTSPQTSCKIQRQLCRHSAHLLVSIVFRPYHTLNKECAHLKGATRNAYQVCMYDKIQGWDWPKIVYKYTKQPSEPNPPADRKKILSYGAKPPVLHLFSALTVSLGAMTTVRDVMTVRSSRMYTEAYPDLGSLFGSRFHPMRSPILQAVVSQTDRRESWGTSTTSCVYTRDKPI